MVPTAVVVAGESTNGTCNGAPARAVGVAIVVVSGRRQSGLRNIGGRCANDRRHWGPLLGLWLGLAVVILQGLEAVQRAQHVRYLTGGFQCLEDINTDRSTIILE